MQLSSLYRRGVIRPLDNNASNQLAAFRVDSPIRVEWLAVASEEQFGRIWDSRVFRCINDACGIDISDYKEVELKSHLVKTAHSVVDCVPLVDDAAHFAAGLKSLLLEAMLENRSVYFVF